MGGPILLSARNMHRSDYSAAGCVSVVSSVP